MTSISETASINVTTLGPYVSAAAAVHGPVSGDLHQHLDQIMRTAMSLVLKVDTARAAAEAERPIRSFQVTGVLSVDNTRNPHRTQIGIDTGQSRYGPDQMWTEFEDAAEAAHTRAVLESLVGRRVVATKQTFLEYAAAGEVVVNAKGEKQTRTRLAHRSLFVLDDRGEKVAVELGGAVPAGTG